MADEERGYVLKALRRFTLTSWTDRYTFYDPVENFDGVKVMNLFFTTPTTGNNTIEFAVTSNPEFNQAASVEQDGKINYYMFQTVLDPRADVSIFQENRNPVFELPKLVPQLNSFKYELTINGVTGDGDISGSNPVYIEIGFFKKL